LNKKTQKETPRRASLLPAALVAFGIVALAVGAILLSASPGGQQTGSTERPYVGGDLHSLAVDPTDPDKVVVGGHDGGAISSDGGKTWRQAAGLEGADPMGWVISPDDPSKMYVGGHPGFYRSEDGGKTWSQDNSGLPGTDVHGLGMDLQNPDTLYAYIANYGIYRSPDAGESWEPVGSDAGIMGPILVDPRDSDTLYISSMEGGFRESTDGGETWQTVGPIPGGMVMSIAQDQKDPDTFYAAGGEVYKSTDGGKSWQAASEGIPGGVAAVAVSRSEPRVVYAGVLEGGTAIVYRSDDGGESWRAKN
jgi:photosystem II stability/assembly factor-like uncharacterized protein